LSEATVTTSTSAEEWDSRYRSSDLVWGTAPNRWVEREAASLPPGRALDLACGEGRNSIWLAQRGWQVTGIDFSAEAIAKARTLAQGVDGLATTVDWRCADATTIELPAEFDLALLVYLQLPAPERRAALAAAWRSLAPGGTLIVIAHDSENIEHGVGGPQDPAVLYTAADVAGDLAALDASAQVELVERVSRPVATADRPALDALFRARRADNAGGTAP
jgi:SAM-dependent methyltransferase